MKLYLDLHFSIVVLAGDTSPVDVICHMPIVCEEGDLPYCYTPSKEVCMSLFMIYTAVASNGDVLCFKELANN